MAAAELTVSLRLKDEFTSALRKVTGGLTSAAGTMSRGLVSITNSVLNLKTALVGLAAGGVLGSVTKAFAQSEVATLRFEETLRSMGRFTPQFAASMQEFARTIQATGTASDDAVIEVAALLAMSDKLATRDIPRATQAAVDLAARLGVDLPQAAKMVTQAIDGQAGGFSRLGIRLDETAIKSGDVAAILGEMERRFGGFDAKLRDTTTGGLLAAANAFDDLKEQMGGFVASVLQAGPLDFLKTLFEEIGRSMSGLGAQLKGDDAKQWGTVVIGAFKGVALSIALVVDGVRLLAKGFMELMGLVGSTPMERLTGNVNKLTHALGEERAMLVALNRTAEDRAVTDAFQSGALSADEFQAAMARATAQQRPFLEATQKAAKQLEAAKGAQQSLTDILTAGAGESGTAYDAMSEAIAGTEARLKGMAVAGNAAADSARRSAEAAGAKAGEPLKMTPIDQETIDELMRFTALLNEEREAQEEYNVEVEKTQKHWHQTVIEIQAANEASRQMGAEFDQSLVAMQDFQTAVDFGPLTAGIEKFNREMGDGSAESTAQAAAVYENFLKDASFSAVRAAEFVTGTIKSFSNAVATFVGNVLDKAFEGQIRTMQDVGKIAMDVLKDLVKQITQELVRLAVQQLVVKAIAGFAEGGVIQGGIEAPANIPRAAAGGVFRGPQMVMVGDNPSRTEAAVPLPDGRSIPVRFEDGEGGGARGPVVVNFTINATDAKSFADQIMTQEAREAVRAAVAEGVATRPQFRREMRGGV